MLSLFCSHDFTPMRQARNDDRQRLGAGPNEPFSQCLFISVCTGCGKVKTEFRHQYGAPFDKDYHLDTGETAGHHRVRRCLHCPSIERI
jgi:hypothetical protein